MLRRVEGLLLTRSVGSAAAARPPALVRAAATAPAGLLQCRRAYMTPRFHACPAAAAPAVTAAPSALRSPARAFSFNPESLFRSAKQKIKVETPIYDKENKHYNGKVFGIAADDLVFYGKVVLGVVAIYSALYVIFKGYAVLTHFSLQNVARLGFLAGFGTCFLLYSLAITCIRRTGINPNAVYNQSIALVMHNERVQQFLGAHPRTGDFKAYCSTGGFKFPLVRRIRSGSYELADLLGLKPRRLQMLFVLKHPSNGREGLVSCAVQREGTGLVSSTNVYTSLAISLSEPGAQEPPETLILIGKPEDVVARSFLF